MCKKITPLYLFLVLGMLINTGCFREEEVETEEPVINPFMQYYNWRQAAPPVGKRLGDRRKLAWWNPYVEVNTNDIWPQMQTSIRARNLTTLVLVVDALFEGGYDGIVTDSLWGGVTYPLLTSDYDQTLSKFFEIWIKGFQGQLHIDLGSISEDINSNGLIDTEDRPVSGFTEGNGLLEEGEDVGLDGCPDEFEDGMGGCLSGDFNGDGTTSEDEAVRADNDGDETADEDSVGVARMIYDGVVDAIYDGPRVPWADLDDPNGDNFSFTKAFDPNSSRNDDINGTEGNSQIAAGSYPDTEDLDRLGGIHPEDQNDYFTFSFQLDPNHPDFDPILMAEATEYSDGTPTGWRLFRIPLTYFVRVGDKTVNWDNVKHFRMWIDGLDGTQSNDGLNARIQIASIEFVGDE
ncbi:MAG: hypothetical protein ACETWG_03410 [Candidatus Neomarinimicrobiota bacterium]